MATTTRTITIPPQLDPVAVLGPVDEVIREVERAFPELTIIVRGNRVAIMSRSSRTESDASQAEDLVNSIIQAAFTAPMDADTVRRMLDQRVLRNDVRKEFPGRGAAPARLAVQSAQRDGGAPSPALDARQRTQYRKPTVPGVITFALGQPVRAKTAGQIAYVNAIESHTVTFGIGPAGTGKTYLAVAKAVRAFQDRRVRRIILTRPAVEAGESLGFLPGTLNEKVDPYLRPLYDALSDMLGADQLKRYLDDGTIEVAPLAYMRGRTLNDAFVILDEAQNTTEQQMKMFLTRLGFNTTMVITGDVTQVDLTVPRSGLASIERILGDIDDIAFVHMAADDVVRHRLVGRIVAAYERHAAIDGDHRAQANASRASRHADRRESENDARPADAEGKETRQ
ncbi:phosphate starvation protein PhoH [Bifidobacterium lemurum]|uniref:PhoH-like protein n=1 Tax=Bifidobacterium lemurum TaxID=1603886 RepID=A0A261FMI6_9BIFI|nr:PhoH family protein [Bifidobacterium lemurum]OZG60205.1 phosphate starvation protein PhoH [Bifidobacterium lemurum]QOL34104.1 PhoH family protein [Bifidobacterium lemurum]